MMKNNFEHAHVVENIRFARAQKKRDCYSLPLSSNSALNFVSIFGEHPIYVKGPFGPIEAQVKWALLKNWRDTFSYFDWFTS